MSSAARNRRKGGADMPADTDAERAVLGACMQTGVAVDHVETLLTGVDFHDPQHQKIWYAIHALHAQGQPTGPVAVNNELQRRGTLAQVAQTHGNTYVADLYANAPPPVQAGYYARVVREKSELRRLITAGQRLIQYARSDDPGDLDDIRAAARAFIDETPTPDTFHGGRLVTAGTWIFDAPDIPPALWGHGPDVLWARGESLIIGGPTGVGKTTLAQQVVLAGVGAIDKTILGHPVEPLGRVLYLAMDRPEQARRSLARMVAEDHRDLLDQQLLIWKGPPPADVAKQPTTIRELASKARADTVVLDSLKDTAVGLSADDVGAAVNQALQICLADGLEVLALHHNRKSINTATPKEPQSVDEFYGSTWLTAGAGSVISLFGVAGDPIVSMRHLKQPAAEVGPYQLIHDHERGTTEISHGVDVLTVVMHAGKHGMTARALATLLFPHEDGKNTDAEIAKARRRLDRLVQESLLKRTETGREGRGQGSVYHALAKSNGEVT